MGAPATRAVATRAVVVPAAVMAAAAAMGAAAMMGAAATGAAAMGAAARRRPRRPSCPAGHRACLEERRMPGANSSGRMRAASEDGTHIVQPGRSAVRCQPYSCSVWAPHV